MLARIGFRTLYQIEIGDLPMSYNTKVKMMEYAAKLPAGTVRAQCYHIAELVYGNSESIADAIRNDHSSRESYLRASQLMVDAGCAEEINAKPNCYGTFVFQDGSTLA